MHRPRGSAAITKIRAGNNSSKNVAKSSLWRTLSREFCKSPWRCPPGLGYISRIHLAAPVLVNTARLMIHIQTIAQIQRVCASSTAAGMEFCPPFGPQRALLKAATLQSSDGGGRVPCASPNGGGSQKYVHRIHLFGNLETAMILASWTLAPCWARSRRETAGFVEVQTGSVKCLLG